MSVARMCSTLMAFVIDQLGRSSADLALIGVAGA